MRIMVLAGLILLTACQEGAVKGDGVGALGLKAAGSVDEDTRALVLKIVREMTEDASATVSDLKAKDTIVCGLASVNGQKHRFYADLEDEEAFFADGDYTKTMVNIAC